MLIGSIVLVSLLLSCNSSSLKNQTEHQHGQQEQEGEVYTCPMHPEIIRDKPGKCPICGMDLVEKGGAASNIVDMQIDFLLQPTNEYVLIFMPINKALFVKAVRFALCRKRLQDSESFIKVKE